MSRKRVLERVLGILTVACAVTGTTRVVAAPPLMRTLWSCMVPCQTNDEPPQLLKPLQFAWCSDVVLTPDMIDGVTSDCKRLNRTDKARAVRHAWSEMVATCESSGNACDKVGPIKVGYSCTVQCGSDVYPQRFSVCALNNVEAWSAASQVCPDPRMPSYMPQIKVCDPNGQTPCEH